ncbi:MAG TPA: hypothetical protein VFV88_14645, partial [Steroidobacteraceae bacterium]|nr:hypothetical protein [Steroidobacteraceae bacterium]
MLRKHSVACLLALACLAAPCWGQLKPLFVIPTEDGGGVALPAGKPARVRITSVEATRLAEILGVQIP